MPSFNGSTDGAILLVDVDGDTVLDLIGAATDLTVSLGNSGTEDFGTPMTFTTSLPGISPALDAADFDHDMVVDLVGAEDTTLQVLRNIGGGSFSAVMPTLVLAGAATDVATGDFNADDLPDVVVTTGGSGSEGAWVYFGDGSTALGTSPAVLPTDTFPHFVEAGDIDSDGDDDVAVVHDNGSIGITLSNGDGTFEDQQVFVCTGNEPPRGLVLGDLNGDCALDLATVSGATDSMCLFLSE